MGQRTGCSADAGAAPRAQQRPRAGSARRRGGSIGQRHVGCAVVVAPVADGQHRVQALHAGRTHNVVCQAQRGDNGAVDDRQPLRQTRVAGRGGGDAQKVLAPAAACPACRRLSWRAHSPPAAPLASHHPGTSLTGQRRSRHPPRWCHPTKVGQLVERGAWAKASGRALQPTPPPWHTTNAQHLPRLTSTNGLYCPRSRVRVTARTWPMTA